MSCHCVYLLWTPVAILHHNPNVCEYVGVVSNGPMLGLQQNDPLTESRDSLWPFHAHLGGSEWVRVEREGHRHTNAMRVKWTGILDNHSFALPAPVFPLGVTCLLVTKQQILRCLSPFGPWITEILYPWFSPPYRLDKERSIAHCPHQHHFIILLFSRTALTIPGGSDPGK